MQHDIQLRDVVEADLPIFFEQQRDPEANAMAAFPARERDDFVAHWARILKDESIAKKTILFDGQVAGNVVSFDHDGQREVGYWLGKDFWGRGIATRALSRFLGCEPIRPLCARVARHNVASIRVLEKCGFRVCVKQWILDADLRSTMVEEVILVLTK